MADLPPSTDEMLPTPHPLPKTRGLPMGTMNASLTNELQDYVEGEVATGDFASASEVVRPGLHL
jgi:Bacterial antitoxin of ParD toxin-antitoxin type II system and RHH